MSIPRNLSCPCGSKLKYKKCCYDGIQLKHDKAKLIEAICDIDGILNLLMSDLDEGFHADYYDYAVSNFYNYLDRPDHEIDEILETDWGSQLYCEWVLLTARFENRSLVDWVALSEKTNVEGFDPEILQALGCTRMSFFEMVSMAGDYIILKDVLSEDYHFVKSLDEKQFVERQLVTGRIVNTKHGKVLLSAYAKLNSISLINNLLLTSKSLVDDVNSDYLQEAQLLMQLEILKTIVEGFEMNSLELI
ncbi:MAG: SEC-C domain-containing protein [Candidatus Cloacimonetes bacterium]|nr:SEC-C domain-containing protein [Candidatus Cloacimonadota bacterium]